MADAHLRDHAAGPLQNVKRTGEFWARATAIYMSFKVTQAKAVLCRTRGWDEERIANELWEPQHERAGERMYRLCIDLRGFYLKAGQFLGARGDFVPKPICKKLSLLHDQVPPMPPAQVRASIEGELGAPLEQVFEWINLEKPLGSASISQVHKAKLLGRPMAGRSRWWRRSSGAPAQEEQLAPASLAAAQALQSRDAPKDGVVAVKIQYPDALEMMSLDLKNIRLAASYLSKAELKFDLVSPVDELAKQIKLEFDFEREARVMDTIRGHFRAQGALKRIDIPSSIPGLTTKRLLVMSFIDGLQITRLGERMGKFSARQQQMGIQRILSRVSEAYGRMMLYEGLFQADGHPGNILVMKGGQIGLIDYGQSKQLPDEARLAFARLVRIPSSTVIMDFTTTPKEGSMQVVAMDRGVREDINAALWELGIETPRDDVALRSQMAYGMFDTRGKVDPFAEDSPIKQLEISHFPPDMFFVLRTVQLLRGLAKGMGVDEFSSASQWRPYAEDTLQKAGQAEHASPAKSKWKPFGADYVTEWPPRTSEVLAY